MIHSKTLALTDYPHLEKEVDYCKAIAAQIPHELHHEHRYWEYGMALAALFRYRSIKTVFDVGGGKSPFAAILAACDKFQHVTVIDAQVDPQLLNQQSEALGYLGNTLDCQVHNFTDNGTKADAIVSISVIEHTPDEETYLNSLFSSANKLVFLTCDYHASGLAQCPYHLRTYNSKLMLGIQLIGESYGYELIGGESDYRDGGTEVNGYTFASIGMVKR